MPLAFDAWSGGRSALDDDVAMGERTAAVDVLDMTTERCNALAERQRRRMEGPLLDAVMEPAEIGFSGKFVSPSSNRIRVTGTLSALAATWLNAV
jgi:hypothetical protein